MTEQPAHENSWGALAIIMGVAWVALTPLFVLTPAPPTGDVGQIAYWIAESGGVNGAPILVVVGFVLLVGRPGISGRDRARELFVAVLVLMVALGSVAWANEYLLKPALGIPRPNLMALAEAGELGNTVEAFYGLGDKAARSEALREQFAQGHVTSVSLSPEVQAHWISETGYSFPSGHATAAFTLATFLVGWCTFSIRRGLLTSLAYGYAPWAVLVAVSRVVLRVHSATDVLVGATQGLVMGLLALLVFKRWITRPT